eukprot:COSAG05_NODE_1062_length_5993_cov_8.045640_13_plen_97_part_00
MRSIHYLVLTVTRLETPPDGGEPTVVQSKVRHTPVKYLQTALQMSCARCMETELLGLWSCMGLPGDAAVRAGRAHVHDHEGVLTPLLHPHALWFSI